MNYFNGKHQDDLFDECTNVLYNKLVKNARSIFISVIADTERGLAEKMFFDEMKTGMCVEITIEAYNQNGALVLTNVTEAVVKCKRREEV